MEYTFNAVENLRLSNSFGTLKQNEQVMLQITIGVDETRSSGYYEIYDDETSGCEWYAEGGLWFDTNKLVDYDGVFNLPMCVCDYLQKLGFDTSYVTH